MKRIFVAPFNWFLLLTMPIWGGAAIIAILLADVYRYPRVREKFVPIITGRKLMFTIL